MSQTTTINYEGEELEIEYDYFPAEPEVRYYKDGSGYPGCGESVDIISIRLDGLKLDDEYFDSAELEEITDLLLIEIKFNPFA